MRIPLGRFAATLTLAQARMLDLLQVADPYGVGWWLEVLTGNDPSTADELEPSIE